MELGLVAILGVFVALMAGVLWLCLRGRRRAVATEHEAPNPSRDEAEDNRVAMVIFGAILVGAALAIAAGLLLFYFPK